MTFIKSVRYKINYLYQDAQGTMYDCEEDSISFEELDDTLKAIEEMCRDRKQQLLEIDCVEYIECIPIEDIE